jgi:hypothetical protein
VLFHGRWATAGDGCNDAEERARPRAVLLPFTTTVETHVNLGESAQRRSRDVASRRRW